MSKSEEQDYAPHSVLVVDLNEDNYRIQCARYAQVRAEQTRAQVTRKSETERRRAQARLQQEQD